LTYRPQIATICKHHSIEDHVAKRDTKRFEAYAKGVAAGEPPKSASVAAGYSPNSSYYDVLFKEERFQAAVARWKVKLRGGASPDLAPIIDDLMAGAEKAIALNSGAGMHAACRMLAEAGRLKRLLPLDADAGVPHYEMTREEWLATFAPQPA
jgi:hypothetical protein